MTPLASSWRRWSALLVFGLSIALWATESDVITLIAEQEEVLFGRYSERHMGALLVITPLLWGLAAALWSRQRLGRALGNFALATTSTLVAILLLVYLSSIISGPARYVERDTTNDTRARELELAGVVRHRPPNERYELVYSDVPEHARSYPDAPPGYGDVPIILTSDANGFRNPEPPPEYRRVVVGDSFAAGSHVSDDQGWVALLHGQLPGGIYNLGVSGGGPRTYLNNFIYYGLELEPRQALLMLYEGNDFKDNVVLPPADGNTTAADTVAPPAPEPGLLERLDEHLSEAFKSSPVTAGLRRLSSTVFERANSDRPVPGYAERMGFMPLRIPTPNGDQFYSFEPKRLMYLNWPREEFANSKIWRTTRSILEEFVARCEQHGIEPVLLYAPSKPHVTLPLVQADIPAQQLWNFARVETRSLPEPETLKQQLFDRLDNQSSVVMQWCRETELRCLDLTPALSAASAEGTQTYYTYDQHWTPDGNRVVAEAVQRFLEAPAEPE